MSLQMVALALAEARDAMLAALLAAERDDFDGTADALDKARLVLERTEVLLRERAAA